MRIGLKKQQKVTEIFYNAKDPKAEIYTHDTKLKKRLLAYAEEHPEFCRQIDDDEQGGLTFVIDKKRISMSIRALLNEEEAAEETAE